jgi:hypothetical protein
VFTVPEIIAAAPTILVGFGNGLARVNTLDIVGVQPILVSALQQQKTRNVSENQKPLLLQSRKSRKAFNLL